MSKSPGRTQLLNLFELPSGATVMDLPGYGYAAVPGRVRSGWQQMIEGYLLERESLAMLMVLVDGEIGPTKLDLQMLDWLRANEIPHTVVATKLDKIRPSKSPGRRQGAGERLHARSGRRRLGQRGEEHRCGRAAGARARPPGRLRR